MVGRRLLGLQARLASVAARSDAPGAAYGFLLVGKPALSYTWMLHGGDSGHG